MKKTLFLITILITIVCIVGCVASNEKPGSTSASTTAGATSTALTQITTGDVTSAFVTEEILPPPTDSIEEGISWPEGQAIPWFATPEKTLDVIMRGQIADDERLTVLSLQGIVNKTKPRLLIPEDNAEEGSLTWANTLGCILRRTSNSKVMEVIKKYSSEASGVVLYSAARSPHYANLAATVAGTMDALPMTMTVYSRWKAAGIDLPVLADLTELTYSKATDIYTYLYDNYWDKCNHRLLISLSPDNHYNLRDISNAVGCASVYLDCTVAAEKRVFEKFLTDMQPGNGIVMGWFTTERSGISTVASHGLSTVPADFFNNATVYAGAPHTITNTDIPKKPDLENKSYIMLIISDGDNIQYNQHAMKLRWDSGMSSRGKTAINWTISPALVDIAPNILNYYYKTATKNDCLIAGPSGLGYALLINTLGEPGAPEKNYMTNNEDFTSFVELTNRYLEKSGIRVVTIWDCASDAQLDIYTDKADYLWGLTVHDWDDSRLDLTKVVNDKLVQQLSPCYCENVDNAYAIIYQKLRSLPKNQPSFTAIQLSVWGDFTPARINEMAEKLKQKYPNAEFVRADHYYALYNEANSLPFAISLSDDVKVEATSSKGKTKYILDAKPTGYIWEASEIGEQTLTFELGGSYELTKLVLHHAEANGKSKSLNSEAFTIEVSTNGTDYTSVFSKTDNTDAVTTLTLDKTPATHIRITIADPGADGIARLADLEIFGISKN